eukprot:4816936-Prymnesium_polylepis.1
MPRCTNCACSQCVRLALCTLPVAWCRRAAIVVAVDQRQLPAIAPRPVDCAPQREVDGAARPRPPHDGSDAPLLTLYQLSPL